MPLLFKMDLHMYSVFSNTVVTYTCTDGSSLTSTCDSNGEWSDPGLCPPGCPDAPNLELPFGIGHNYQGGFTPSGSSVTLSCSDGATTLKIICGADGIWGERSGECPVGCADPAPELKDATSDYVADFYPEFAEVTYTCNVLGATSVSVCQGDGTWSAATACPIFQPIGSSFFPSKDKRAAIIMSHPGYESGDLYLPNRNANWYFHVYKNGCKPTVTFLGDVFQTIGKNKCKADYVVIQQWKNGNTWKTKPFCGTAIPSRMPVTTAKWDDVRLRIIFRSDGIENGLGFMARVSYEHCF